MIEYTIGSYRRNPDYEVKAIISNSRLKSFSNETYETLLLMRRKMEKMIPPTYRPRYNVSFSELVVTIRLENASRAHSAVAKLTEVIKEAKTAIEREQKKKQ